MSNYPNLAKPDYYYVWGGDWDRIKSTCEYTFRPKPGNDYVVLSEEEAIIFRLTHPDVHLNPYHDYSYRLDHLNEI